MYLMNFSDILCPTPQKVLKRELKIINSLSRQSLLVYSELLTPVLI